MTSEQRKQELEQEDRYFTQYPYVVEIYKDDFCEDSYRTDSFSNAQAKFDKWTQDLQTNDGCSVKMFQYNPEVGEHFEIDYFEKIEYLWQHE